jgi:cell division protein FtsZ
MLFEVEQAANRIRAEVDPDANIIFGNTILDNMEGRIRVSVVATGIEAAEMRMGRNIEQLTPRFKPRPVDVLKAAAASVAHQKEQHASPVQQPVMQPASQAANPVHRQVEALADELNVNHSPAEAMILGNELPPEPMAPAPMPEPLPAPVVRHTMREEIAPMREPEQPKRRWGLFGRKKEEPRHEPVAPRVQQQQPARAAQPRAMAQAEPLRPQPQQPQTGQAARDADLFADQKRDEQFEIPAFLRRQTN